VDPLKQPLHYRAAGRRITLRPDPALVAVDLDRLDESQRDSLRSAAGEGLQEIAPSVAMFPRKGMDRSVIAAFLKAKAISPVFSSDGAKIIARPQVRIEPSSLVPEDSGELADFGRWLEENQHVMELLEDKKGRFVIAPVSGYGPDAVTLADDISSRFKSLSASPRFVRVVPKP
jgi:hypothetical protein